MTMYCWFAMIRYRPSRSIQTVASIFVHDQKITKYVPILASFNIFELIEFYLFKSIKEEFDAFLSQFWCATDQFILVLQSLSTFLSLFVNISFSSSPPKFGIIRRYFSSNAKGEILTVQMIMTTSSFLSLVRKIETSR